MEWIKKGRLLNIDRNYDWCMSHATLPIYFPLDDHTCRIYFSTRDGSGKSYPAYAVFDSVSWELREICEKPLLEWGRAGTFDDSGIMLSSLVEYEDKIYAYYIGWNQCYPAAYHVSIGLAISEDKGITFKKYSDGPILDRSLEEPIFNTAPFVLYESGLWKMWYVSCTHWIKGEGEKLEPVYFIRYATSDDGIHWQKEYLEPCINYKSDDEALSRPWVIKEAGTYKMWYSYRHTLDYRSNKEQSYKIGYAESENGIDWERKDEEAGIWISHSGWDSLMICNNSVFQKDGKKYMLYNGNLFGKEGFGLAEEMII